MIFGPLVFEVNCLWNNKVHVILNSNRVYCPCILGAEMPEIRISLASPLLALRGGWEAGITNHHTPTMETTTNPTAFLQEKEQEPTCPIVMMRVMRKTTTNKRVKNPQMKTCRAFSLFCIKPRHTCQRLGAVSYRKLYKALKTSTSVSHILFNPGSPLGMVS